MLRQGVVLALLLASSSASAQYVHKCIGKDGAVSYQSDPCPADAKQPKVWNAPPELPPTNAELWRRYYQKKQGEADSHYLSRLAGTSRGGTASGHRIRQDGARNQAQCDAAKASREQTLAAVGMLRTYELLQRLDENVREACR